MPPSECPPTRTATNAPRLAELQAAFAKAVIDGDDGILALLCDNSRTDRVELLGVYRHGYLARLCEIIGNDYRALAGYLGAEAFEELVGTYIRCHPSTTPNARWIGQALPTYLATAAPYQQHAVLAELAALEQALADAFDSADANRISIADLAGVPPAAWGDLRFVSHPSVRRLDLTTNAHEIWRSLSADGAPPEVVTDNNPQRLLIWREGLQVQVRVLAADEAKMWDAAAAGQTFGEICALAARLVAAERAAVLAATFLQAWITAGQISRVGPATSPAS